MIESLLGHLSGQYLCLSGMGSAREHPGSYQRRHRPVTKSLLGVDGLDTWIWPRISPGGSSFRYLRAQVAVSHVEFTVLDCLYHRCYRPEH